MSYPVRLMLSILLLLLFLSPGQVGEITRGVFAESYLEVGALVLWVLFLFYWAEKALGFDFSETLRKYTHFQVPLAALLGATPGCAGAIIIVTAFCSGHVRFGAVVATLTATMGDAAFVLVAERPDVAAVLLPLSFAVGIVTGYIVDWLVKIDFSVNPDAGLGGTPEIGGVKARHWACMLIGLPGLYFAISHLAGHGHGHGPDAHGGDHEDEGHGAHEHEEDHAHEGHDAHDGDHAHEGHDAHEGNLLEGIEHLYSGLSIEWLIGAAGLAACLAVWTFSPLSSLASPKDRPATRAVEETSMISVWVLWAFLAFEYVVGLGGVDLERVLSSVGILLPLMAIIIGLIPGSGPQILVTTLYINGAVPFSALLGNAISNDGDALFPAIALSRKAALWAIAITAVPALVVAYLAYFVFPGLL